MNVPDRVRWAVEVLDPRPEDEILEIGSGPGVAASLVCQRLQSGRLLALDRSPVAVERIGERNADHVAAGRLAVRQSALADLIVPPSSFDKAFAVNVNVFWVGDPARELAVLKAALREGGSLHILYGAGGPTSADRVTGPVAAALREHGFAEVTARASAFGIGVTARR
ncbi:class I SAM-dependent methyltransferase [Allokutzneria sp. A3M-2-11 16]|uniref:class I SAM-dependent methyltransferase n=1 Tax=Allokutzneria sp. A3M-2-11 16 TaxID=2962043 RepID=UPI0020B7C1C1|nr:class I SAM-dependent methyltransferase [Allokutzneria sp. A3M-2-11 16]MCP3802498.1 class I SAM-dependent methyltransferase [Allokutzneria sp. A3M-2-11 16]